MWKTLHTLICQEAVSELIRTDAHPHPNPPLKDIPRIEEKDQERSRDSKLQPPPGADQVCHASQDELAQGEGEAQQNARHCPAPGRHPLYNCGGKVANLSDSSTAQLFSSPVSSS